MVTTLRQPEDSDDAWIIARHGAHYAQHEGFDGRFPVLVARILQDFRSRHDPSRERAWVAVDADGTRLGSIFCVAEGADGPGVAKLRLFFMSSLLRGAVGWHRRCLRPA